MHSFFKSLFLFILIFTFTGCSSDAKPIRYDVPNGTTNLDPQYATDATALLILSNTYEGLVRKTPEGEIILMSALEYTVSDNQLVYTFKLDKDRMWSDDNMPLTAHNDNVPLTAHDFVFSFHRIMSPSFKSPHSPSFMSIENSQKVLDGSLPKSHLGVKAIDDYTLEFTLSAPDPLFLEKLSLTSALPTNEAFFEQCNGKYGLEPKYIINNGPFEVDLWDNKKYITLKKNSEYYDKSNVEAIGMNIHINREDDKLQMIKENNADIFTATHKDIVNIDKDFATYKGFNSTIWTILINPNSTFTNQNLSANMITNRISQSSIADILPINLSLYSRLIPSSCNIRGENYVDQSQIYAPPLSLPTYNPNQIHRANFLILDTPDITESTEHIVQILQKDFSIYPDKQFVTQNQLNSALISGEYDIILMPLSSDISSPDTILSQYALLPGVDEYYDTIMSNINNAQKASSIGNSIEYYQSTEQLILNTQLISPLFEQIDYCIISNRIEYIEYFPHSDVVYIKNAKVKK